MDMNVGQQQVDMASMTPSQRDDLMLKVKEQLNAVAAKEILEVHPAGRDPAPVQYQ